MSIYFVEYLAIYNSKNLPQKIFLPRLVKIFAKYS